jgi:hypothetical protein
VYENTDDHVIYIFFINYFRKILRYKLINPRSIVLLKIKKCSGPIFVVMHIFICALYLDGYFCFLIFCLYNILNIAIGI